MLGLRQARPGVLRQIFQLSVYSLHVIESAQAEEKQHAAGGDQAVAAA